MCYVYVSFRMTTMFQFVNCVCGVGGGGSFIGGTLLDICKILYDYNVSVC